MSQGQPELVSFNFGEQSSSDNEDESIGETSDHIEFFHRIHDGLNRIYDNIEFFETFSIVEREQLVAHGYHNMKEGVRSTHTHTCDRCNEVYSHQHNIKSHYMQYLYPNLCDSCNACYKMCTEDHIGQWRHNVLPQLLVLKSRKAKYLERLARIGMPSMHKYFHHLIGVNPDNTEEKDLKERISKIEYATTVTHAIKERLDKMASWSIYLGQEVVGPIAPMVFKSTLSDELVMARTTIGLVYIGHDALRFVESITSTVEYKFVDLYMMSNALEQERISIEREITPEYQGVFTQLTLVMRRIQTYLIKRVALQGFVPVSDPEVLQHMHYSKMSAYDFTPIMVREMCNIRIFRSHDGYKAFVKEGEDYDVKRIITYMNNSPFNHIKWVDFKLTKSSQCNVEQLLSKISDNMKELEKTSIYEQLVYALSVSSFQSNEYYAILNYLKLAHFFSTGERATCKAYIFSGKPGIGKTYDIMRIAGNKKNVYYYSYDHKTKQYFDGYKGQSVMVIDDLGHHTKDEWLILLKLITDAPYTLPMARAELKDFLPSLIEEIYISTNCIDKLLSLDVTTRDAICRRCEVFSYDEEGVNHQLYNRPSGCFTSIQRMSREDVKCYFEEYVHCYRQEPRIVTRDSMVWKGLSFLMDVAVCIKPELGFIRRLLHLSLNVETLSSALPEIVGYGIRGVVFLCKRKARLQVVDSLIEKERLTKKQRRQLLNELHNTDTTLIPSEKVLIAEAMCKNNILSQDLSQVYEPSSMLLCGRNVVTPDLTPYVQAVTRKCVIEIPEITDYYTPLQRQMYPEIDWCTPEGLFYRPPVRKEITKKGYVLRNLTPELKKWYKEDEFTERYAPLSDTILSRRDESEYKPWFPISEKVRYSVVNQILQQPDVSNKKTNKRKMERFRFKQRQLALSTK